MQLRILLAGADPADLLSLQNKNEFQVCNMSLLYCIISYQLMYLYTTYTLKRDQSNEPQTLYT